MLGDLGFHYEGDQRFKFPTQASPALPAKVDNSVKEEENDRIMVEGCTNPGSLMSRPIPSSKRCSVIPIDRNIDWCSKESYDICIRNFTGSHSALWFSSPCIGGSMWSRLNMHRGSSTVALILSHWAEFHRLWKRFEEIAKIVIPKGVAMFTEWPLGCRYWADTRVARFLNIYGVTFADVDGCMYGLVATKDKEAGTPINKPWGVAYLNPSLGTRLNEKCDGSHIHTPCSGQNTSITEGYTPENHPHCTLSAFATTFVVVNLMYLRTPPLLCICTIIPILPQPFLGSILPCQSGHKTGPTCPWQVGPK